MPIPVKPTLLQKFFARDSVWVIGFLAVGVFVVIALIPHRERWMDVFLWTFLGAPIGFAISWMVLLTLKRLRIRVNGGPFHNGDVVQVIAGKYAGRIATVCEEWPGRNQVRVDLGEVLHDVDDVFSYLQLVRAGMN